ncbi:MAG TPA: hypothetical protein VF796_16765 [Humisphaera sp.]
MSLPIALREAAEKEFDAAFDWYEEQDAGVGVRVVAAVQRVFDRIAVFHTSRDPSVWQRRAGGTAVDP